MKPRLSAYVGAVLLVALSTAVTGALWTWMAPSSSTLFFPAVMIAASYGGRGPGLVATTLSAAAIAYFFMPPYWSFKVGAADLIRLVAFIAATMLIASVADARRRAERAFRQASDRSDHLYQELQASFERESRAEGFRQTEHLKASLLDALTHNLRTPLTAMKAAVTALRHGGVAEDHARRELVEVIDEEVDRLNRFVGGLGTPTTPSRIQSIAIRELLATMRSRAEAIASGHQILTDIEDDDEGGVVEVDPASTVEALYLVLDNAAKYSRPGTSIRVTSARCDAHHARVTITDEGPGIPLDMRERVFERFFRIPHPADVDVPGSGLGLAIARQLLLTQGGRIWIEDPPSGTGAAVVIELPTAIRSDYFLSN